MTTAYLAARIVVVTLPAPPGQPNLCVLPREGFEDLLLDRWETLKEIEGPSISGTIAFTWEDDPAPDSALVTRTAAAIDELLEDTS